MAETTTHVLITHHRNPADAKLIEVPVAEQAEGEIRVAVEKFGLTSNNVTYAALGDAMAYKDIFPAPDEAHAAAWSCLPVWGMGRVLASGVDGLDEGQRFYGFFPAAGEAVFRVADTTGTGFRVDRPGIPPEYDFYHVYNLVERDPFYAASAEELMVVLRPLFLTGLLLADYLEVSEFMGAKTVIVSSAASKTSFGLAHALHRAGKVRVVGMASEASRAAAEALNVYDEVIRYQDAADAPVGDTVYVDICGKPEIRQQLAARLGGALQRIIAVGITHWQEASFSELSSGGDLPTEFFFAPGWTERRRKEAGQPFLMKLVGDWQAELTAAEQCFGVVKAAGPEALLEAYLQFATGGARPEDARVHTLAG